MMESDDKAVVLMFALLVAFLLVIVGIGAYEDSSVANTRNLAIQACYQSGSKDCPHIK